LVAEVVLQHGFELIHLAFKFLRGSWGPFHGGLNTVIRYRFHRVRAAGNQRKSRQPWRPLIARGQRARLVARTRAEVKSLPFALMLAWVEFSMRRAVAASVAVMMMVGGGASYALFGRHAPRKMEFSASATDAPRVESARMFAAPIAPPEPDLIAAKLAPPPIVWPDAPKPAAKVKRPEGAKTDAAKPEAVKRVAAPKPKSQPKPKKQAAVGATVSQ
jgi:hypothetical protein